MCLLLPMPCLPVMRIIPASAGWQAQHGLCSGSGSSSGSGTSTRAQRALSRPRRRARPFRQHLVRPGWWTSAAPLGGGAGGGRCDPAEGREGGGVQLKVAILGEYSVIIISSSVDRGSLSLLSWSLCRPSARVQQVMGCWMVQTRLPASHRWPASPPFSSSRDHQHKKGGVEGGRRPLLRRPRIALPAQKKERTPPHTISHKPNLNGVEGQRTSCRKYYLVEDHCGPCPHTHRGSPWRAGRCGTEKIGTTPPCWVV